MFERMRQHEGPEARGMGKIGRGGAVRRPFEQRGIGRGEGVPVFLHFLDRDVKGECEGGLGEPRRNAHAHPPGGELD